MIIVFIFLENVQLNSNLIIADSSALLNANKFFPDENFMQKYRSDLVFVMISVNGM